jgi:hypothetical protein
MGDGKVLTVFFPTYSEKQETENCQNPCNWRPAACSPPSLGAKKAQELVEMHTPISISQLFAVYPIFGFKKFC